MVDAEVNRGQGNTPFWAHREQYKAAVKTALLLDKPLDSTSGTDTSELLASINKAFENNVAGFSYTQMSQSLDCKQVLEMAMKAVCLEIQNQCREQKSPLLQFKLPGASHPSMPQLLGLSKHLGELKLLDSVVYLTLLSEAMESIPVHQGEEIVHHLEANIPYIKANFDFTKFAAPAKLRFLGTCNNILARLSRAQSNLLAGRIHLILSQCLPTSDRSAVNPVGFVNDSNPVTVEAVPEGAVDTKGEPVNAEFYTTFWSLHAAFEKPATAMDPDPWTKVRDAIKEVLAEFQKVECTVSGSRPLGGLAVEDANQETLTVRFISSPKVLSLQIRDAEFRRHFLLQCLILMQAGLRKASNKPDAPLFRIKQQGEAEDIQKQVYAELARTPQNGQQFHNAIKRVMQREDQWADWKADGARSFEREPQDLLTHQRPAKKRRLKLRGDSQAAISLPKPNGVPATADVEMADVSKGANPGVEANGPSKKRKTPKESLKEFLEPVIEDMDPENAIEDAYKRKGNPVYKWEALRHLSRHFYTDFGRIAPTKEQNLEDAIRLILPEHVPAGASKTPETNRPSDEASTNPTEASGLPVPAPEEELADTDMVDAAEAVSEEEGELPDDLTAPLNPASQPNSDGVKADAVIKPVEPQPAIPQQNGVVQSDISETGKTLEQAPNLAPEGEGNLPQTGQDSLSQPGNDMTEGEVVDVMRHAQASAGNGIQLTEQLDAQMDDEKATDLEGEM